MIGTEVTFIKKVASGVDDLNNPTYTDTPVIIGGCLVAPITEPASAREQQAFDQSRDQLRVHLPKTSIADVANSSFVYDGKTFTVDSDSVIFMAGNTPTQWNRYFRAECING